MQRNLDKTMTPIPAHDEQERALLPCPFCDSAPELFETIDMGWVVECSNCAGNVDRQESAADAADSWNARASRQAEGPSENELAQINQARHEAYSEGYANGKAFAATQPG